MISVSFRMQTTRHILMVRPARFQCNAETADSNAFQHSGLDPLTAQARAAQEFDAYVEQLRTAGVDVMVVQDSEEPHTPDSVFPNNWVSFHEDGTAMLYPMEAHNRRLERRADILDLVAERFNLQRVIDISRLEGDGLFLESTGSMVLDREHRIAYVCHSSRSHPAVMKEVGALLGYRACWFHASDAQGAPIYHTNVMMSVGRSLAIVCLESIRSDAERTELVHLLQQTGKTILDISLEQTACFAGNMLELQGHGGQPVMAMSGRAWRALNRSQQQLLQRHVRPVAAELDTIETLGGGGARCMIAEIHLTRRCVD
jgi:hypothetical protein